MSTPEPEPDHDRQPDHPETGVAYHLVKNTDDGVDRIVLYERANPVAWIQSDSWHTPEDADAR